MFSLFIVCQSLGNIINQIQIFSLMLASIEILGGMYQILHSVFDIKNQHFSNCLTLSKMFLSRNDSCYWISTVSTVTKFLFTIKQFCSPTLILTLVLTLTLALLFAQECRSRCRHEHFSQLSFFSVISTVELILKLTILFIYFHTGCFPSAIGSGDQYKSYHFLYYLPAASFHFNSCIT